MMTARRDEEAIFNEARRIESPQARRQYLETSCGEDAELSARVEALLRVYDDEPRFLQPPADLLAAAEASIAEGPGTSIGPYKLLEQIGEGGFGMVFMAEQQRPVLRKVALKIVKPGMDTRQVIARFEAERQALALMDHPNIAHVFDGGTTAAGRPYFVMELVRGTPITEFCDQSRLPPRQRLELFLSVCQAVQHAHSKGIIHRDLKPSNVLVTMNDGMPVIKIIDFGIAKALGGQLTEKTLFTGFAQMVGTPRYMSPEQSQKSGHDIDTRTDIYALGVLLYELLTGSTPLDEERLRQAGFEEIGRLIREEEPPPPSTRIGMLGEAATVVSAYRASDPLRLGQLIHGELDWIALKALEKDRNRRYETASAFAADVRRYLADEQVLACPPSRWYRFGKFARRNKVALSVTSVVVAGAIITIAQLATSNALIRREQGRTQEAKDRAEQAEKLAEQRAADVRVNLDRLKSANALLDRGRAYVIVSRWDDAQAALTKAVELRADHATAWHELGDFHARLGLWREAANDFSRELEVRDPDTTSRWYLHALLRLELGDKEGYREVTRRMREHFHGTYNVIYLIEVVRASALEPQSGVDAQQLVELGRHAVAYRPRTDWWSLYALGLAHYRAGEHQEAVRRLEESLTADDRPWSVRALSYPALAMARHRLGQPAEAREALLAGARVFDHWTEEIYQSRGGHWVNNLGAAGEWAVPWWDWLEGRLLYREAKLLIDGSPPPDDPRVHVLRARGLAGLRWHDEAEAEYGAALARRPDDPQIALETHRNRGYGHVERADWHAAAAEFALASELAPDEYHLTVFTAVGHLAAGEIEAYQQTCRHAVETFGRTQDPVVACDVLLACVLRPDALPDLSRLAPLIRVATIAEAASPAEPGGALYRMGEFAEAAHSFETMSRACNLRGRALCFLAMARQQMGQAAKAKQTLAQAIRWIDQADRAQSDDLTETQPTWGSWHEKIECKLLLEEARKIIE